MPNRLRESDSEEAKPSSVLGSAVEDLDGTPRRTDHPECPLLNRLWIFREPETAAISVSSCGGSAGWSSASRSGSVRAMRLLVTNGT